MLTQSADMQTIFVYVANKKTIYGDYIDDDEFLNQRLKPQWN